MQLGVALASVLVLFPVLPSKTFVWMMLFIFPDHLFKFHFVCMGFPCGSAGKESVCNAGELGSIPGLERFPGERKGYTLQYSDLENSMDCIVHGVATGLRSFYFHSLLPWWLRR